MLPDQLLDSRRDRVAHLPATDAEALLFNTDYGDVLPRFVGMLMLALGIIVLQAVRHRLDVLYPTALIVRSGVLPIMLGLYLYSGDPLFITLLVVVGIGVVLTGVSYWLDRRSKA